MTNADDTGRLPSTSRQPTHDAATSGTVGSSKRGTSGGSDDLATKGSFSGDQFEVARKVRRRQKTWAWARSIVMLIVLAIPTFLVLVLGAVYWQARTDETRVADAIVVLGAAQYNGRPTEVFKARLDHAFSLYEVGYAPRIVLTGGGAVGDAYTEAESGEMYLEELGVPAGAMILANEGNDTWSSFEGVADVLDGTDIHSLLLVSDGFHLLRSELVAENFGFEAHGSASTDSPIRQGSGTELSYAVRETGGIVSILPKIIF